MYMEIINTYTNAYNIGKVCIDNLNQNSEGYSPNSQILPPREINNPKWKITTEALENTLKYIFNKLHHPCYMLCVTNNIPVIYKLESTTTSSTFQKVIEDSIPKVRINPKITTEQKQFILNLIMNKPVRIMQCVVKEFSNKTEPTNKNEYMDLLKDTKLPNGVFILNLTDAIILRNNGREPFTMVTGDKPLKEFNFDSHIPILSMSSQKGYADIPIPNYDDLFISLGQTKLIDTKEWSAKTSSTAIFRGGPSGCGYTTETNMRLRLATMKSPDLDVGITGTGATIDSKSIRFDPKYGLGMLNTGIKPANYVSMAEQSNHKYIIHVDGNVNAYRLLTTMATGSLILRVESEYKSWVDHLIKPNKHYIPVKPDLSDLLQQIEWCKTHDRECSVIAKKGNDFARSVLNKEFMISYFEKLFWGIPSTPKKTDESSEIIPVKEISPSIKLKNTKCPKGTRKNKKGDCVPTNDKTKSSKVVVPVVSPVVAPVVSPVVVSVVAPVVSPVVAPVVAPVQKDKVAKEKIPKEKIVKEKIVKEKIVKEKIPKEKIIKERAVTQKIQHKKLTKADEKKMETRRKCIQRFREQL